MQITRRQIIDYLQTNRIATSIELSRALLVTAANIRHHIQLLEKTGLVEIMGQEPVRGRGRPMKVYGLTENALRNNYEGLAGALLKTLLANRADDRTILSQIATHLLGDCQAATNIHLRLNQSVDILNKLEYNAAWEASASGPRIIFRNCPYAVILSEHPELCRLDVELLSQIFNQPVKQTAKLERSPDGSPYCVFVTLS